MGEKQPTNWQLTKQKDWAALRSQFSWVRDMEGVPQDPLHHAEGDVAQHTQMVLNALVSLPQYQALQPQEQEILWASALLHDVEKRSTTVQEDDGRITSKGHAKKGERTARLILYTEIPTPFETREAVAKLVLYHGLPLWIFEKEDSRMALLKASLEVNTQWLSMLARADVLGRICEDQADLLYRLDLFDAFCQEQGCWGRPYPFASDLTRYAYFQGSSVAPDFALFDETQSEVILLSGLPGVGKDHFLRTHYPDLPVVSLDALRREFNVEPTDRNGQGQIIQAAKEKARVYLRKHQPFVWNATNLTRDLRGQLIDLFTTYKARVTIVYLEVPDTQRASQNMNRQYSVPETAIRRMLERWEIPALWESHQVQYMIQNL